MPPKFKVILSDLHLGAGFAEQGNPLEDFIKDAELACFLDELRAESEETGSEAEVIIAGDFFEFLQVPAVARFKPGQHYPPELYRSTSEAASVMRTNLVVNGHPRVFQALREWLNPGPPRRTLTILKGNHDVELYWPGVQARLREAVGATGEREPLLSFPAVSINREGLYVEHGNQYAEKLNRFDNFADPRDPTHPDQLETPPGSVFVYEFFNDVERERFWVDSVKPITALLWYGFALDFSFAARTLLALLKVAPILVEEGTGQLLEQLADPQGVTALGQRYATDPAFQQEFLTQVERLLTASGAAAPGLEVRALAVEEASALDMGKQAIVRLDTSLREAARRKAEEAEAQVVVFGHTHRACCVPLPDGVYLNTGTWVWWRDFSAMTLEDWRRFYADPRPFMQPHYLTYARVDYDEQGRIREARVLDYSGAWDIPCTGGEPEERKGCWGWVRKIRVQGVGALRRRARGVSP